MVSITEGFMLAIVAVNDSEEIPFPVGRNLLSSKETIDYTTPTIRAQLIVLSFLRMSRWQILFIALAYFILSEVVS